MYHGKTKSKFQKIVALVILATLFVPFFSLEAEAATIDLTPRISYWAGKVNQHTEDGVWKTDPDGVSGANIAMLTYCKKWYPDTVSVEYYGETSEPVWRAAGNTGSYTSTKPVYKCVQPTSAPDLTFSGFGLNGPDANNNNTVLLVPSFQNVGTALAPTGFSIKVEINKNGTLVANGTETITLNEAMHIGYGTFTTYRTNYRFVDPGTYTIKLTLQNVSGETNISNNTTSKELTVTTQIGCDNDGVCESGETTANCPSDCPAAPQTTYSWYASSWTTCLNSTQARTVYCKSSTGAQVIDSYCANAGAKPVANQSCLSSVPDLTFSGFGLNGPDANNNNTVLLVPSFYNVGTKDAPAGFTIKVEISKNGILGSTENISVNQGVGVGPGAGTFTTYRTNYNFVDPGTYTIKLTLQNVTGETNTANNTISKDVVVAGATTDTNCQVTLDGIIYKLSPCEIKTSMIDGDGGKTVTFKIDQVGEGRSYNFETYGYNEGFQTNGFIPSTGSGGASGDVNIEATFRDDVLNADGETTKKYSGYLPIKIYHGSYGMGVEKTLKLMIELDVLPKAPSTDTNCQITLDNTVYQLSPCEINTSMTDGAGDKEFSFKLDQVSETRNYGFGVSGYGEGFPTNGIITTPFSGGASGDVNFKAVLKDQYLNAENGQTKKYNGYLPIKVSYSSFGIEKTLKLMVNVDVSPAATLDPTPRISYWPGKVNQHTENGVWKTDPDGTSGSTINMLTYCKKWYPNTVRYEYYKDETITDWKRVYNTGSYTSTKPVYKCILDATTEQHDFIVQNIQAYFLPQVGNYMTLYIKFDDLFAPNDNLIDYEFKIDAPGAVIGTSIMQPNNNAEIWRTIMYNTPGMHRLTVTVDPNNKINEVNENNNSKSYSIEIVGDPTSAKPDLKITDIFLENNLLKAKYCNIGTTAISPSYFYIKMTANSKVHTGTSNNSNYPFSVPASDFCGTTDGYPTSYFGLMNGQSYLVDANIDWDNRVAESNEYNNGFSKNITMGGATTTASLTLTKNQAYGNQNFTKPTTQAKVASFVVSAGANSGVNIDTINISQATSGTMQNMKLMTGSTQIGATKVTLASNNTTENVFTAYNLNLAAGESKVIDVYADIKAGSGTNSFALVVDLQGTATSGVSVTTGDVTMQAMTLAAGSITSSDGGKPASAIIVAGTTVKMNAIKFTASGEPFTITKVRILEDNPSNYDSINKVILEYKDKSGNTVTKEGYLNSGGIVGFTGLNMYVPKDSTAILTVKAEIPTISAGADSGDQPRLIFDGNDNFSALGESSNMVNTFAGNDVYGNNMTVRKTVPTFMTQSLPTSVLNNGTATLYKFTVAADAAGDVAWKKISFKLETGGNVGIAGTYLYEETNPSLILGNGTIGNESIIEFALLAPENIPAGSMRTYIVKGTVTNADGGMVKLTSLGDYEKFMWSDLSVTPVSVSFGPWIDGALVKTFGGSSVLYNSNYVPPVTELALGDLDANGQVQMYDAALLARYLAKQSTLTTAQLTVAEVTSNSVLDNTDVEVISDYAMGKVDKLPVRFGDVDGNGLAETYDAALVLGHVKGTSVAALNLYQKYVADVNRDGLVTEDDSTLIGQAAIGLITLPAPKTDPNFAKRLAGRLLLATEDRGRIFYIYPVNYKKYEITFDNMMSVLPRLAAGISDNDLNKIPISLDSVSSDVDSDDDGFSDYSEVKYGYNPFVTSDPSNRGNDKVSFDRAMAYQNRGRFLLQVEDRGRLWYVDFSGQRWEITWANAMSVFPKLSLGITNADLAKIPSGNY